jgi:FkbM family methyltransferase
MDRKLVFDVGMNNGDDTAYYLSQGYRVVGIEANPALAEQVAKRFRSAVDSGILTILNVAIAATEGVLPFWVCEDVPEWCSFDRSIASRNGARHHEIEVQCRRFASVIAEFGVPHAIKIDIEGHDFICAQDLKPGLLPKYLSIELGDKVLSNLAFFRDIGFREFKLINQRHLLPVERSSVGEELKWRALLYVRDSRSIPARVARRLGGRALYDAYIARLRVRDGTKFPIGSSGPIGEATPGRWQSFAEFHDTLEYFNGVRAAGKPSIHWGREVFSFWADIHMRS